MTIKRFSTTALALLALCAVAAPAAATAKPAKPAKTFHYEGETDGGQSIGFDLTGKSLSGFDGVQPTRRVRLRRHPQGQ